jgi:hypothetical protein
MRSQWGPERLLLASKKPHIQQLVAQCDTWTLQDVDALTVKPDIKKGLRAIVQSRLHGEAWQRAEKLADLMMQNTGTKI